MRWCFLQRTIPNTKSFFIPLEEVIRDHLIPAIVGRNVSDIERRILSLPVRMGGLGIQNPVETADTEFHNSSVMTKNLSSLIQNQEQDLVNYDREQLKKDIQKIKMEKEEMFRDQLNEIKTVVDIKLRRSIELACEKGAGAWLSALPIQAMGYVLNKQEFRDSLCLRYGWKIPNTPLFCACKTKNSVDHTLNCKRGGYVSMRHNNIRDFEASLLKEICKDVKTEPMLIPIGDAATSSANQAEKARPDVSAVGVWSSMERTFVDVRIVHLNSPSYVDHTPEQIYCRHEQEKKRQYNNRILQVEKGSFSPLIFSTSGGMGPESTRFHKRIAELLSVKRGESYAEIMNFIRTRIRFSILKSTLIAVRGERGKIKDSAGSISDISLNLIPERTTYEV